MLESVPVLMGCRLSEWNAPAALSSLVPATPRSDRASCSRALVRGPTKYLDKRDP